MLVGAQRNSLRALLWGSVGVLIFSVSLPATRMAVVGGLDPVFIGAGRAVVAGLLAFGVLAGRGELLPPRGSLPALLIVSRWPVSQRCTAPC